MIKNRSGSAAAILMFILLFVAAGAVRGQQNISPCSDKNLFRQLDFWVGEWTVYSGDVRIGENRIEKVLDGCAILEHWSSARGTEGKSLFYVDSDRKIWKQVWVTSNALRPGGTKEKQQVATLVNGAIRFLGSYRSEGTMIMDRTTLIPVSEDTVRQLIQISSDGGDHWIDRFNGVYIRKPGQ